MTVLENITHNQWKSQPNEDQRTTAINALESGKIVFLPQLEFSLTKDEMKYLSPNYSNKKSKNISYNLHTDRIRGEDCSEADKLAIKSMMHRYSKHTRILIESLFPQYKSDLQQARTSFRTFEAMGRQSSPRKDDTRLHVDAFPSTPVHGNRIMRVFSNINPSGKDRVWRSGEAFEDVVKYFLSGLKKPLPLSLDILNTFNITKSKRSLYDHYMLQLHHAMKADNHYQTNAEQSEVRLPPASTWIVFTDQVSHAAKSGQHLLEQTFHLPVHVMENESRSPLRVFEKCLETKLT